MAHWGGCAPRRAWAGAQPSSEPHIAKLKLSQTLARSRPWHYNSQTSSLSSTQCTAQSGPKK
eukprot:547060-Alexandrium_andersonii.AAC.1